MNYIETIICVVGGISLGIFYLFTNRNRLREISKSSTSKKTISVLGEVTRTLGIPFIGCTATTTVTSFIKVESATTAYYIFVFFVSFIGTIVCITAFLFVVATWTIRNALKELNLKGEALNTSIVFLADGWGVAWDRVQDLLDKFRTERDERIAHALESVNPTLLTMIDILPTVIQQLYRAKIEKPDEIYDHVADKVLQPYATTIRQHFSKDFVFRMFRRSGKANKQPLHRITVIPPKAVRLQSKPHRTESIVGLAMKKARPIIVSQHMNHKADIDRISKKLLTNAEFGSVSTVAIPLFWRHLDHSTQETKLMNLDPMDTAHENWACWGAITVDLADNPAYDFREEGLLMFLFHLADHMDVVRELLGELYPKVETTPYNHPVEAPPPRMSILHLEAFSGKRIPSGSSFPDLISLVEDSYDDC